MLYEVITHGTVQRMNGQMLLDRFLAGQEEIVSLRSDDHAGGGLCSAGTDRGFFPFLHDQAHAARPEGIEGVVVAHGWDNLARAGNVITSYSIHYTKLYDKSYVFRPTSSLLRRVPSSGRRRARCHPPPHDRTNRARNNFV